MLQRILLKAYSVTEIEVLDTVALASYAPAVLPASQLPILRPSVL
jgi:hypothetical protein